MNTQVDFDTPVGRRGTDSVKWKVSERELPMWVADMDFRAAQEILDELSGRVAHGVFGYGYIPDEWYHAYIDWWGRRHDFTMKKDWLLFCTGVIPAISSAVRKLTTPGENVLVQTPVYNIFFNCIADNGRRVLENPLRYEDGIYSIDWEDLERKLADPQTAMMLLCNPHNPIGKIWERETLARIGTLCKKYHVTVLSDEIHCDITAPGRGYIPFASVSEICRDNSITCVTPTKAFNLAGLHTAAVCVPDEALRHKIRRALNTDEAAEPNSFAVPAAVAAFGRGEIWLDAMRDYVFENRRLVSEFVSAELPQLKVVPGEATYLIWLDAVSLPGGGHTFADDLRRETGLYLISGDTYGKAGEGFLRMNVACPRSFVTDALRRLKEGVVRYVGKEEEKKLPAPCA